MNKQRDSLSNITVHDGVPIVQHVALLRAPLHPPALIPLLPSSLEAVHSMASSLLRKSNRAVRTANKKR